MVRIALIEDEKRTRDSIKQVLSLSGIDHTIAVESDRVGDGLEKLIKTPVDLALLDVEIKQGTSFDILRQIENINFKVVFITAHQEYAIKAFEYAALDYILKPIHPEKLIETVKKADDELQRDDISLKIGMFIENMAQVGDEQKKVLLKTVESIHIVTVNDIVSCCSDGCYTEFHLVGNQNILVSKTIKEFEEMLPIRYFLRVHHSHLINLNHLKRFDKADGGSAIMSNGQSVPVSQRKRSFLIEAIERMG